MKTRAVRLYDKSDIRLEEFDLPEIKDDEILVKVVTDSICMSTWKCVTAGKDHKRVPNNIDTKPVIIGHEFSGDILKVGKKWQNKFHPGKKFAQQPALPGQMNIPGYSFEFCGGDATYCIFPNDVIEKDCFWEYDGDNYYSASLAEPMGCCIRGYRINYHTHTQDDDHIMGTLKDGNVIILGGCGPMGLGSISYGLAFENKPKRIVVTDIDDERINRAKKIISPEFATEKGVELIYVNTSKMSNPKKELIDITNGDGYSDVFVMVPSSAVAELGDQILGYDGCLNLFAGPRDANFSAVINLYNYHYSATKAVGFSGGRTENMKEATDLAAKGEINPSVMITHIGGLNSVAETTLNLPNIPGGKKLVYTHIDMPMTAIDELSSLADKDPFFAKLDKCCKENNGLWSTEAEKMLLDHFEV